jgi:hypothetical protein
MRVDLLSVPAAFHTGTALLMGFTIYAVFRYRNLGRFLASAQLLIGGLLVAAACFVALQGGMKPLALLLEGLNGALQLILAYLLLFGRSVKEYARAGVATQST